MSRHRDTLASIILHTFVRKKIGEKKRNKFHRYLLLVEGTSRHPQLNHSFILQPKEKEKVFSAEMFQGKLAVVPLLTIYLQCKMRKLINVWVLRSSRRQSFQYFLLVKPLLPISRCLNTISRVQQYSYAWHKLSFHMYNEVTITLQLCSSASKDKNLKGWGKT